MFERGGRALKLTEEDRALFERTSALLTDLEETTSAIASGGHTPRGRLRISAPLLFSQTAMGKLAAEFALKHPEVRLEVTTEDRAVDMVEEGYDLAIRVNPDPDESLVGRIFLRDRMVMVASPQVRPSSDGFPVPAVVRGLAKPVESWTVTTAAGKASITVQPSLSPSSLLMIRDAVRMGVGAARLPISLVGRDLAAGTLVNWGDVEGPEIALWALYPSRWLLNARVSAFLDHLKGSFPQETPNELANYLKV
ncbi:LysR family transcriptional regulator [Fulvimarina endophytica]|uniref:LysR family transcriptional regulator n=1 Tax=Fulvimarina endophytica TaxID=2293836 RepID=A0A371WXQ0_9HYPH|nr:LysR family transcriptional regulator [Fulvimarina endophytica]